MLNGLRDAVEQKWVLGCDWFVGDEVSTLYLVVRCGLLTRRLRGLRFFHFLLLSALHRTFRWVPERPENLLRVLGLRNQVVRQRLQVFRREYGPVWSIRNLPNSNNIVLFVAIYDFKCIPGSCVVYKICRILTS